MKKILKALVICFVVIAIDLIILGGANYSKAKQIEEFNYQYKDDISYFEDKLESSIIQIFAVKSDGEYLGTGFFMNDQIITSYHVVSKAKEIFISFNNDYFAYKATISNYDEENDIATLRALEEIPVHSSIDFSLSYEKEDLVYICGFDIDYSIKPSIIEEEMYIYEGNDYIKINTPVNRGNSGGPVIDKNGKVIGILSIGNGFNSSLTPIRKVLNLIDK